MFSAADTDMARLPSFVTAALRGIAGVDLRQIHWPVASPMHHVSVFHIDNFADGRQALYRLGTNFRHRIAAIAVDRKQGH